MKSTIFENTLEILNKRKIKNLETLRLDNDLNEAFWLATKDFVLYALGSTKNSYYINELMAKDPCISKEDVVQDCLIQIINNFEKVVNQPIEIQKNYCYKIINNICNNFFTQIRRLPKIEPSPLPDTIESTSNVEEFCMPSNVISECAKHFLKEISVLSKHPEEIFARMNCVYLKIKPRELEKEIIETGIHSTYAWTLFEIADMLHIDLNDIRQAICNKKTVPKKSLEEYKCTSDQISKYANRAKDKLRKKNLLLEDYLKKRELSLPKRL